MGFLSNLKTKIFGKAAVVALTDASAVLRADSPAREKIAAAGSLTLVPEPKPARHSTTASRRAEKERPRTSHAPLGNTFPGPNRAQRRALASVSSGK